MIQRPFVHGFLMLLALSGCDGFLGPDPNFVEIQDGQLKPLMADPSAPPLERMDTSFWIVRGQWREVEIRYSADGYNGKCIRLIVPPDAPLRHPDGRIFATGDSALVTLRIIDPELFLFEFGPAGIRFNPAAPARIEIRYRWATGGTEVLRSFRLWRQERESQPWVEVPSQRDEVNQEVHANVDGFTRYMLASD